MPLIPPLLSYKIETHVTEKRFENNTQELGNLGEILNIRVFVVKNGQSQPILAATINMPPTDLTAPIL